MDARLGEPPKHRPIYLTLLWRHWLTLYPDTARALGLEEGDAHVIRNAGGRASDALRSIVISQQLLGTREIVIVHHVCDFITLFALSILAD